MDSIRKQGILEAIQVTPDHVIISGHRRWNAAQQLGIDEVPAIVREDLQDDLVTRESVIIFNKNREKTQEQKYREGAALIEIETERAKKRQGTRTDLNIPENLPESKSGDSRDIAASKIGLSGKTLEKGIQVVQVMDAVKIDDPAKAEEIKETLEKSVNKAYSLVKPIIEEKKKISETTKNVKYSVDELPDGLFIQRSTGEKYNPTFNETNDRIEWAKWSWNPVTGCRFGCPYCYAKAMAENEYYANTFMTKFNPTFHPGRLSAPNNHHIPASRKDEPGINNVFLCSMADLWGDWIPSDWIRQILDIISNHPEYNFIALTKNPKRYLEFAETIPLNVWLGATADTQQRFDTAIEVFKEMSESSYDFNNIRFLSCEPLLEEILFEIDTSTYFSRSDFEGELYHGYVNWVIIGGLKGSENSDRQPKWEWVENLINFARKSDAKVYFKTNLTVTPKELPI